MAGGARGRGALALEPVWQNLTFGQVNLFLMLAVLVDLLRPERRWTGVLLGLAAGVKLAPLVLVVMLVLVGGRMAAGRAIATFAGTVLVGFVVMPGRRRPTGPTTSSTPAGSGHPSWPTTSPPTARSPGSSTSHPRRCCGWPSPDLSPSPSCSWAPGGGGAATGSWAPASERWPC